MSKFLCALSFMLTSAALLHAAALHAEDTFCKATPGYVWQFPRDHGAHRCYETEWWYYTGQLVEEGGDIFQTATLYGFQLTFFRRALKADAASNPWNEIYLAHGALSDIAEKKYLTARRMQRGGLPLAGASDFGLNVFNGAWHARQQNGVHELFYVVGEGADAATIALQVTPAGPVLLEGDRGFSKKGNCAGCASYYYSVPFLNVTGTIQREGNTKHVAGLAWMDHEFMTNALGPHQVGWDWFSVMGKDRTAYMLFTLRNDQGGIDFASGMILKNGASKSLASNDFIVRQTASWKSPASGARYPSGWTIEIPGENVRCSFNPLLQDQEMRGSADEGVYWEGAIRSKNCAAIGYAELTGYAKSMAGKF